MQYGICPLSLVSMRTSPDDCAPMLSQLLYGEHFKILEQRKTWSRIRSAFDKSEGWIPNAQLLEIPGDAYDAIQGRPTRTYSADLVSYVETPSNTLMPILLGSSMDHGDILPDNFEGSLVTATGKKDRLIETALHFLNAPYMAGGKSPFGIDGPGLSQMVYKLNGTMLYRGAAEQATQGIPLSFIEESEPGDLAFFDNSDGIIDHVGLIMENNYVIHVNGMVRIDRIDHTGIFNTQVKSYTHTLRVIKKVM